MAIRISHYVRRNGPTAANNLRKAVAGGNNRHHFEPGLQLACEQGWVGMEGVAYNGLPGRLVLPVDNTVQITTGEGGEPSIQATS